MTPHYIARYLKTNHILSARSKPHNIIANHITTTDTTRCQNTTTTAKQNGWRLVHTNNSVWASHWLVGLHTFFLAHSFFGLCLFFHRKTSAAQELLVKAYQNVFSTKPFGLLQLQPDIYKLLCRDRSQQSICCKIFCCAFPLGIALVNCITCSWEQSVDRQRICQKPAGVNGSIVSIQIGV